MIQSHLILFTLLPIFWHFFIHPFPYPFFFFHLHDVLFSCCFSFTRRISSSVFLKRLRKNSRHTNCDHWEVSACPLLNNDHLHSIRTKQKSQGFYLTCHTGRTILDCSVMTITEEKLQKLISGSEILALKDRNGDPHHFQSILVFLLSFGNSASTGFRQFLPYATWLFRSTIPGVNGFCEDFKPGRRLKVGREQDTWTKTAKMWWKIEDGQGT